MEFHIRIRTWRERLRITQAELGEAMGVGRQRICHIESGRTNPKPSTIIAVESTLERMEAERADELVSDIAARRKALLNR